jgi:CRISPR-associated exonuclease Cas4
MVTATQISSYMYCPRKLFISSVLKIKEPPKEALVKGLVWHQTYQTINTHDEKIVKSITTKKYEDILDIYRTEYAKYLRNSIIRNKTELKKFDISMIDLFKEYWSHFEEEAKSHSLNLQRVIEKNNVYGAELWELLTPKILSEQHVKSETHNLSGIIDVTEVYTEKKDGEKIETYVPVELKTGKVPAEGIWDTHRMQLAVYMTVLEDSGKNVVEGVMRYKGAEDRILQYNPLLKEEVLKFVNEVQNILESTIPPSKVTNTNKCQKCSFKAVCYDDKKMSELLEEMFSKNTIAE